MNIKSISIHVGKALSISALFMFISTLISIYNGFDEGFTPLVISTSVTFLLGIFPMIFVRRFNPPTMSEGFVIIVISWFMSFIFGMLPYVLYGREFSLLNAWFESVSGFTTTGSTILTDIEALPKSLLFWRSSTHFIGGLGVIILLLLILPENSLFKYRLSSIELSSISRDGYRYRYSKTVRVMLNVYLGLTISESILLISAGMTPFDAVNHAFSTVATGGFSTKNTSIMHYDSPVIDMIIMIFMTLSAMHFGIIFAIFAKRSFKPLKASVCRYYLTVICVLSIGMSISLSAQGNYSSFGKALLDGSFQAISFLTTTGFGNADTQYYPVIANLILMIAAFHCGCSGSTTGGIKADRILLAFKAISNELKHRTHPSSVVRIQMDGARIKDETVSSAFLYIIIYLIVLLLSFCLILACGMEVSDAFSATVSSIGNVGPGTGNLGTMGNFNDIPSAAKIILTLDMILGRIEIFPVLIVLTMISRKSRN